MSPIAPQLQQAARANLALHFSYAQRRTAGMRAVAAPDLVQVDCGIPCDTFNAVCNAQLDEADAATRIAAVIGDYAARGLPFSWWVCPGDGPARLGEWLAAAGLVAVETELAMALPLSELVVPGASCELVIERVRSAAQLQDFAVVNAANWSPPDAQVVEFYRRAAPALLAADSPLRFYVGYLDGEPVATAEATVGEVVGLYNICTLAAQRGRGFGSALTLQPLLDARAEGMAAAILQASADGVGLYRRLGFRDYGLITEYKPA